MGRKNHFSSIMGVNIKTENEILIIKAVKSVVVLCFLLF